jgi:beta-glucosidase/6-phospho-beta-glucosidase/beta-galactosidase
MFPSIADDPAYKGALSKDFAYGFASASYQIEGAREERGDCLWDRFLAGKDNGDIAADSYHLFEEDLKCLKAYRATSYRFSVSWPRVIPKGESRL